MMVSRQETQRQLLTPGEVMQLDETKSLVMVAGKPAILADKIRYYADKNFTDRVVQPAEKTDRVDLIKSDWSHLPEIQRIEDMDVSELELGHALDKDNDLESEVAEINKDKGEALAYASKDTSDEINKAFAVYRTDGDLFPDF